MSRKEWVLIVVAGVCILVASLQASLPYVAWLTVVGVLIGVVLGRAITVLFSWYFYQRASDELRNALDTMLSILEQYRLIGRVRRAPQRGFWRRLFGSYAPGPESLTCPPQTN